MQEAATARAPANRWLIAIMGTVLQLCLGTVYAWSFFQNPLMRTYGWSNSQVGLVFCLAICFLGVAAAWGGVNLEKHGPRKLAVVGGALFGSGYLLGAAALHLASRGCPNWQSLGLLYVGYGAIGGIGLGLCYVTPVATVAKWFPDRKGLVTGMVVMGFGFGALLMSKGVARTALELTAPPIVAQVQHRLDDLEKADATIKDSSLPALVGQDKVASIPEFARYVQGRQQQFVRAFAVVGGLFLVVTVLVAAFLRDPPPGFVPMGYAPPPAAAQQAMADESLTAGACLATGRFAMMWIVFFCNIAAGIAIIGFQSPMMQDMWKTSVDPCVAEKQLTDIGGTLVAASSIFNGLGRFFWGGLSDRIGRVHAFRTMLASQIVAFGFLLATCNPWIFGALVCYVLLCYGGGFGTMPSFVMDVFGQKMMAVVYGVILTAWSAAGVAGPLLAALVKDLFPKQACTYSLLIGMGFISTGLILTLLLSDKPLRRRGQAA